MKIDEAIKVNTALAEELDIPERSKEREAVKLGSEALKRYRELRSQRVILDWERLLGETEE